MSAPAKSTPVTHLRPREHGAYAMLAFPVLSGLAVGGPSAPGVAFALLAVAGFLAHEAVLVVLGRRGERIRSAAGAAALRRLAVLGAAALASGVVFMAMAPPGALAWAVPPAVLGAWVMGLVLAGGTKTLAGELLVAVAFAVVHAPVAAAGAEAHVTTAPVVVPVVVWAASFALATLSVHALKARFRGKASAVGGGGGNRPPTRVVLAAPGAAAAALAFAAVAQVTGAAPGGVHLALPAAALVPKALVVLAVSALDVHPRHLKRVGWSLVAADTATLVVLALAS